MPTTATVDDGDEERQNWSLNSDAVQSMLKFIKKRGARGVTAEDLVNWDAAHGKKLFCWDTTKAAHEWRVQQARVFLNSFRGVFDRMRVRKFINIPGNDETGRSTDAYLDTQTISEDTKLRTWAITDLTKRLTRIASELKFWRLTEAERLVVLHQLDESIGGTGVAVPS